MKLVEYAKHKMIGTAIGDGLQWGRSALRAHLARGIGLNGDLLQESELLDQAMVRILRTNTCCIDAGAHLGAVLSRMQALAPQGSHAAIEPVPYKARWLEAKFPRVSVHQVALGDRPGSADFYIPRRHSGFSGLRFHGTDKDRAQLDTISVAVVTLDSLIPKEREIGFLKIDVEGGELAALRGAQALLACSRPIIQFECTDTALGAHEVTRQDVFDFFASQRYGIYLARAWLDGGAPLTLEGFSRAMTFPFQALNFLAAPLAPV